MIFLTADTHFDHDNIISYCARPFKSASHMNEAIFTLWAETVPPKAHVYHLGDVTWGDGEKVIRRIKSLPGKKYLVPGNHDKKLLNKLAEAFTILPPLHETTHRLQSGKQRAILCHYPLLAWKGAFRGAINLFGHVHGRIPDNSLQADVGVDVWGYAPVLLENALEKMKKLSPPILY